MAIASWGKSGAPRYHRGTAMRALRFHLSMPRLAWSKIGGKLLRGAPIGRFAPIRLDEVDAPGAPRPGWARVRTRLAGICGSDVKEVLLEGARDNPLTAVISFPHVLGHEATGTVEAIGEGVTDLARGDRVILDPWLACGPRGVEPPCVACAAGDLTLCRNLAGGCLAPGMIVGTNAEVGGAFAPLFTVHASQLHRVPDTVSDDAAAIADPVCVALHAILRNPPTNDGRPAMIHGLGPLGQAAVALLRRLHPETPVIAVGREPHQLELARALGASEVLDEAGSDLIERVATIVDAKPLRPWSGVPWSLDGPSVVYDMVGSAETLESAVRLVGARGTVVIVGVEAPKRFEWTPIFFKELRVIGSSAACVEDFRGRRVHTIEAYLELIAEGLDVTSIITHRFPLERWREAFAALLDRRVSGAVKVLFEFDGD